MNANPALLVLTAGFVSGEVIADKTKVMLSFSGFIVCAAAVIIFTGLAVPCRGGRRV